MVMGRLLRVGTLVAVVLRELLARTDVAAEEHVPVVVEAIPAAMKKLLSSAENWRFVL